MVTILSRIDVYKRQTLYLGAGMTVKRAWRKVTEGYAREKEEGKKRYAYEEMIQTCHEMDSGCLLYTSRCV